MGRVGQTGRQFIIEWPNGEQSLQNFNHIISPEFKNPNLVENEYVFALQESIFYPGHVLGKKGNNLIVKFVTGDMYCMI